MSFQTGVNFDLTVQTADSMTAATLSTVLKGVILYKKMAPARTRRLPMIPPPSTPTARTCNSTSRATTRNSKR